MTYIDKINEEWFKYIANIMKNGGVLSATTNADFFLSKHNTLLDEIKGWILKEQFDSNGADLFQAGYNQALVDLLTFIETKR